MTLQVATIIQSREITDINPWGMCFECGARLEHKMYYECLCLHNGRHKPPHTINVDIKLNKRVVLVKCSLCRQKLKSFVQSVPKVTGLYLSLIHI